MKHKNFWIYFLFGALIGIIVGFMKNEISLWLVVGSILGFLVASFFESKVAKRIEPGKLIWIGFFLLFPIIFFDDYLKGTFWFDVFGILAVIGSFTLIVNFGKSLREIKKK
ncbi:hypothetical protein ACFLY8_00085 [Halobacteriota archaeon]